MKASFFIPVLAAALVSAHGFVATITIDGKAYRGNAPRFGSSPSKTPSIVRQISTNNPINGATVAANNCGLGATIASQVANANPGSQITFDWKAGGTQAWPHDTGPMLTYLASCGTTTCDKFNSANARWFKIDEAGRRSDGRWQQATLFQGGVAKVKLPATLAPGNYLIRHEIIGLHLASGFKKAEFYPSCSQLRVGGSQTGKPLASELVSFPGAYNDRDPGLLGKSFFDVRAKYVFPGPPVAKFVTANGKAALVNATAPVASATSSIESTLAKVPASNNASAGNSSTPCGGETPKAVVKARDAVHRPHHRSRVMRALVDDSLQ